MNEKKLKIMDIGLTLFSEKGYHSTSIQEIATEAGISKGAFYLYYQSKEDFMASSIEYIYLKIMNQLDQISNEELLTRKKLAQQINILLGYIESYKGFILRFFTESISIGDRMDPLIEKMTVQRIQWMKKTIDRKSTRLNSSHVAISYAVFCLKKQSRTIPIDKRTYNC